MLGRPEVEAFGVQVDGSAAIRVDGGFGCGWRRGGDGDADFVSGARADDVDVAINLIGRAADEMEIVVVDKVCWDFDECDVAGEAAVVEPVGLKSGNAFGEAGSVYGNDDEVIAVVEEVGGFAIVWVKPPSCWQANLPLIQTKLR